MTKTKIHQPTTFSRLSGAARALGASLLLFLAIFPAAAQDVRSDAVFRLTFVDGNTNDITANDSVATVVSNMAFTTNVPAMANGTGNAAVFNGSNSWLSYGVGAGGILQIQSALTYHARVQFSTNGFSAGRVEEWVMGRFQSTANTRVSIISTAAVPVGTNILNPFAGCTIDGVNWNGGAGLIEYMTNNIVPGVFYDEYLRYDNASVYFDIFNAQTGARVAGPVRFGNLLPNLLSAGSTMDIGGRTVTQTAWLKGQIEQVNVWNRCLADDEIQAISSDPGFVSFNLTHNLINVSSPANYADFLPASTPIQFTAQSAIGVAAAGIHLALNGTDVSAQLNITGSLTNEAVTFNGLAANQIYDAVITVADQNGNTKTQTLHFTTFSSGIRFIEGEDYDFDAGQFIDNVVLSSSDGPSNYLDRLSVAGVDVHLLETNSNNLYREGDPVAVDYANDWPLRQEFITADESDPGVADYGLWEMLNGEWFNYSRTFASNQYYLYARVMDGWQTGLPFQLQLGVGPDSDSTPVGLFVGTPYTGGYSFVPLTDVTGKTPVALSLAGVQTLKLTAVNALQVSNVNYFMLVPMASNSVTGPPLVLSIEPPNGAVNVATNQPITLTLLNQGTQFVPSSLHLVINGLDVTSQTVMSETSNGTTEVTFLPASGWPEENVSAALTFQDNAVPPNTISNFWQFSIVSFVTRVPAGNTPAPYTNGLVFSVNFTNGNPNDITTTNASPATDVMLINYTTNLPAMANSAGWGAVFNGGAAGSGSWISYGLGSSNCLNLTNNLTYHVRVMYNGWNSGVEQWLCGRFRSTDEGTSTRVSFITVLAGSTLDETGIVSPNGSTDDEAPSGTLSLGVFYDVFLRWSPGLVQTDVINAQTGLPLGTTASLAISAQSLLNADSPFDVGNRTTPVESESLDGVIAQIDVWNRTLSQSEITNISWGSAPLVFPVAAQIQSLRTVDTQTLAIDFSTPNPLGAFVIQQTASLLNPSWSPVTGATLTLLANGDILAQFPSPSTATFYRIQSE